MEIQSTKGTKMDAQFIICGVGILLAVVSFVISRRAERLQGIPLMTGYGNDHEKAMVEGTMKVCSATMHSRIYVL
jgi:hypothetical protein